MKILGSFQKNKPNEVAKVKVSPEDEDDRGRKVKS